MSICAKAEAPRGGALGKRKYLLSSSSEVQQQALPVKVPEPRKPAHPARFAKPPMPPPPKGASSKLLAGYLAHEFLRFGTLQGERPPAPGHRKDAEAAPPAPEPGRRYAEASWVLMAGGARIPGVVNPTQLGRWLRIKE